jgi:hypothetical protein
MPTRDEPHPTPAELAELSALADGTLDRARRQAVETRLNASPGLRKRLHDERRAVALLHEARARDRAPEPLRAQIESMRRGPARGARPARPAQRARLIWRPAWTGGTAAVLAAAIVALILVLPGASPGSPSVARAARLALAGPTAAAPRTDPAVPYLLTAEVGGLSFPRWRAQGLTAIGQRRDRLGGHSMLTVYYRGAGGRQLAYSILSAPTLPEPGGPAARVGAYEFHVLDVGGRPAVIWRELGHTCVLSGTGVSAATLERLAARVA